MRIFMAHVKELVGQRSRVRPVGVYAPERASGIGCVDDDSAASPSSTTTACGFGNSLRRPSGYGDFLQLAAGEERHVGAVRRPKRIRRALSAREHRRTRRTHTLDVQHVLAGGII